MSQQPPDRQLSLAGGCFFRLLVLDTCALLWHTLEPDKLSDSAIAAIRQADTVLVSSVSLWEIARMEQKGGIELQPKQWEEVWKESLGWLQAFALP